MDLARRRGSLPNAEFGVSRERMKSNEESRIEISSNVDSVDFLVFSKRLTITAAFDAEYPNVACSPRVPVTRPATEAVTMTREGSSRVAFFSRRGANL